MIDADHVVLACWARDRSATAVCTCATQQQTKRSDPVPKAAWTYAQMLESQVFCGKNGRDWTHPAPRRTLSRAPCTALRRSARRRCTAQSPSRPAAPRTSRPPSPAAPNPAEAPQTAPAAGTDAAASGREDSAPDREASPAAGGPSRPSAAGLSLHRFCPSRIITGPSPAPAPAAFEALIHQSPPSQLSSLNHVNSRFHHFHKRGERPNS